MPTMSSDASPRGSRIEALPAGPLDIVGDVHGELQALRELLRLLGHAADGSHPQGRRLVFVGDLVDRGPDSVGVLELVRRQVDRAGARVVLGNHELNLLRGQRKLGNDWFWDEGSRRDAVFEPYARVPGELRAQWLQWFDGLPLALLRDDLRVVHAAWHADSLRRAVHGEGPLAGLFARWDAQSDAGLAAAGWAQRAAAERAAHRHAFADPRHAMPMLEAVAYCDQQRQMGNPLRVLTSGIERRAQAPFYAGGQWRFARRMPWWDDYADEVPVVVGHFWRHWKPAQPPHPSQGDGDLFAGIAPLDWMGPRGRVFCVDYSVGGRYRERAGEVAPQTRLAALRWPERELVLDTGERHPTRRFGAPAR